MFNLTSFAPRSRASCNLASVISRAKEPRGASAKASRRRRRSLFSSRSLVLVLGAQSKTRREDQEFYHLHARRAFVVSAHASHSQLVSAGQTLLTISLRRIHKCQRALVRVASPHVIACKRCERARSFAWTASSGSCAPSACVRVSE